MSTTRISTCGIFPRFARVSGKFWQQGSGFFGFFARNNFNSFFLELATSNSAVGRFARTANSRVADNPAFTLADVPIHKLFGYQPHINLSLCFSQSPALNTAWQANANREQWGAGNFVSRLVDPLNDRYPVRQSGWTGGIYTHPINSVIRRRTGPTLGDCSFWKALQLTSNHNLSGGIWTIHDQGEDPAGPWNIPTGFDLRPLYWTNAGSDGLSGNSFLVGEFFDDERNAVNDDWKLNFGSQTFYRVTSDYMQMPQLRSVFTALNGPNGNRVLTAVVNEAAAAGNVPHPPWLRAIVAASWGGAWNVGNPFGFSPAVPFAALGFVPRGWIAVSGGNYYRILSPMLLGELDEIGDPATHPAQFELLPNRQSWTDSNYPTRYSNFAALKQDFFHAETRRRFTRNRTASQCVIATQFVDMSADSFTNLGGAVGFGFSSIVGNKNETLPNGETISVHEIRQTISSNCGTKKVRNDTEAVFLSSLDAHPLVEPDDTNAVGQGPVGRCRYYTLAPQTPGLLGGNHYDGPQPGGTQSGPRYRELEWIGAAPKFILPGQYIEVDFHSWVYWQTGVIAPYIYLGPDMNSNVPAPSGQYIHYLSARYYSRVAQFFPTFVGLDTDGVLLSKDITEAGAGLVHVFGGINYDGVWHQTVSRNGSGQKLFNGYYPEVRDTRALSDVRAHIYPHLPTGGWFNLKSTPSEQEVHFQTANLRWGDARWFEIDTDALAVDWKQLSPMLLVRQKLSLSGGCCGDC